MPTAHLANHALVDVAGPEALHFLQNLVTTDLDLLRDGEARPGALLTPQGKILFDFLISRNGADALVLDCRADVVDELVRRLTLYKLRAKVTISKREQAVVAVSWGNESGASETDSTAFRDTRFVAGPAVRRQHHAVEATATEADWHALRIESAVAESGADYALGDAFPHDVLLDQNDGVGFKKGCYVGQEVVSRMQHRGTARRRILIAEGGADLPPSGADVTAGGRSLGALGSVSGRRGLAMVRIDRVKDAMDAGTTIDAAGVPLTLSIPAWARFGFPADAAGAESA
jgi:folate-binding protein YgfZ